MGRPRYLHSVRAMLANLVAGSLGMGSWEARSLIRPTTVTLHFLARCVGGGGGGGVDDAAAAADVARSHFDIDRHGVTVVAVVSLDRGAISSTRSGRSVGRSLGLLRNFQTAPGMSQSLSGAAAAAALT